MEINFDWALKEDCVQGGAWDVGGELGGEEEGVGEGAGRGGE